MTTRISLHGSGCISDVGECAMGVDERARISKTGSYGGSSSGSSKDCESYSSRQVVTYTTSDIGRGAMRDDDERVTLDSSRRSSPTSAGW